MQVGILGPLQVRAGGGADVAIGGARLRTLLVRLAIDPGRTVSTTALADALWPARTGGDGPGRQRHALHSLVSRLRQALPDPAGIRSAGGGYRLDVSPDAVDAARFERLIHAGRAALRAGRAELAGSRLREALDLWRGDPLADATGAPFAVPAIARLQELRLTAVEDRAMADLLAGADPRPLVAELTAVTAADPRRERSHALLLRALQADGRPAEALAHYARLRETLADEVGADPSVELREAHLAVLRAEQAPRPRRRRGNLRVALTSFVGRADERALVLGRLDAGRLVTLTGPGGAGKTRLATTVAAELAADLPGSAWLVELAAVTDQAEVAQAALGAVGDPGSGPTDRRGTVDRLVDSLAPTAALLVLDNCEHLPDAVAALAAELLGRCPLLRVLATSREPLALPGEAVVAIPPLPLAPSSATDAELRDSPAVRLFADRAGTAHPGFALTADTVTVVADLCRHLDGLPLAIELAAARSRSIPPAHLATMLDQRFAVLTGGSRAGLPRHRTLAAVVAWSWDLLAEDERLLVEALSVFPGTIGLDAAGRVGPPGRPVAALLGALVEKSLLSVVDGPDLRYRMLETVREYGLDRLRDRGALSAARSAHVRHFLQVAETAAPHLRGPDQLRWIPRMLADRDNLLGALRCACASEDADTAVRLASAVSYLLTLHGDHALAARLLRAALDLPVATAPAVAAPAVAAYLLNRVLAGAADDGADDLDRFRPAATGGHPSAFAVEPLLAVLTGRSASFAPQPQLPPFGAAMAWLLRGLFHDGRADLHDSARDLATAVAHFTELGERWGLAWSLTSLGVTSVLTGDAAAAMDALSRAVVPAGELGDDHPQRVWLAVAHTRAGDLPRARAVLQDVISGRPAAHHLATARLRLGDVERFDGRPDAAAEQYRLAERAAGHDGPADRTFRTRHRAGRAALALATGDLAAAHADLLAALAGAAGTTDPVLRAEVGSTIAGLRARTGDADAAAVLLGAAHTLRGAADPLNPDIARLTDQLRRSLGEPHLRACYERGRSRDRAAATELLGSALTADEPGRGGRDRP